jgi:uncharacterized protein
MHDDLKRQGAFSWSELLSRDLTGSVRFYRDLLGWDIVKKTMDGEPYYIVRVNGEDIASMMKMPVAVPSGVPTYWGTYITVFDVDAIANAVVPLGGTVVLPPQDIPGVGRFCSIQDPHGGVVSFISYSEEPTGGTNPAVYMHGSITWSGLQSRTQNASVAFLTDLLEVELRYFERGGQPYYVIWPEDSDGINADLPEPYQPKSSGVVQAPVWVPQGRAPFWLACVQVDDVDDTASKAAALGGTIVAHPADIPGIGRYCTIRDPQGGLISLITYFSN